MLQKFGKAQEGPTNGIQKKRKKRLEEAIIIESNENKGLGYADILQMVQKEIIDQQTLESIKGVRKTTTKQGEAYKLRQAVESKINTTKIRTVQNKTQTTLHMKGIDSITNTE